MTQETVTLATFGFFSFLTLATLYTAFKWYRGLTTDQKGYVRVMFTSLIVVFNVALWGGLTLLSFKGYYVAQFMADRNFDTAGKIGVTMLNEQFVEGSTACDAVVKSRKIHHKYTMGGIGYCHYFYNDGELLAYRGEGNRTEILTQVLPWPEIFVIEADIFK